MNQITDEFINHAAGRVWVDEQDYAMVKADLHLTDRVNVFGGLVGAVLERHLPFHTRADDGRLLVCAQHGLAS